MSYNMSICSHCYHPNEDDLQACLLCGHESFRRPTFQESEIIRTKRSISPYHIVKFRLQQFANKGQLQIVRHSKACQFYHKTTITTDKGEVTVMGRLRHGPTNELLEGIHWTDREGDVPQIRLLMDRPPTDLWEDLEWPYPSWPHDQPFLFSISLPSAYIKDIYA